MAAGDVDGDGDLDIITGGEGQDVVYLNDGAGNFATARNSTGADLRYKRFRSAPFAVQTFSARRILIAK